VNPKPAKVCENCSHFTHLFPSSGFGECRFSPPLPHVWEDGAVGRLWPVVQKNDWCSKFDLPLSHWNKEEPT